MTKNEVEIGGVYEVRWHDGTLTAIHITHVTKHPVRSYRPTSGYVEIGSKVRYRGVNLKTGRSVEIKSAAKLRRLIRSAS